jgi:hypothetical protein
MYLNLSDDQGRSAKISSKYMTINKFYELANQHQKRNNKITLRPNPKLPPLNQNLRLSVAQPSTGFIRLSVLAGNRRVAHLNVRPRTLWLLDNNSQKTARNNRRGGKQVQVLYVAHGETNKNFRERGIGEYLRRLANNFARNSGFYATNQLSVNLEKNSNSNSNSNGSNARPPPSARIMNRLGFRRVPAPNSEYVNNYTLYFRKVYNHKRKRNNSQG